MNKYMDRDLYNEIYNKVIEEIQFVVKKSLNETEFNNYESLCERIIENFEIKSYGFDIDKISKKELDEVWNRNVPLILESDFCEFSLREPLSEPPSGKIYSADVVAKLLNNKYSLKKWQFYVHSFTNTKRVLCIVAIPCNGVLNFIDSNIIKDADRLGYFYANSKTTYDSDNRKWKLYIFEPKNQKNEASNIRKSKYLYHITPIKNLKSIQENGFIPHSREQEMKGYVCYPERTFFLPSVENKIDNIVMVERMALQLFNHIPGKTFKTPSEYAIFTIDMRKIPENIEMFYDPDSDYGIYVKENIPATCISDVEIYDCRKKERIDKNGFWKKLKEKLLSLFK